LLYGARSREYLVDLNIFNNCFQEVSFSTDNGTFGKKGFVSDLLQEDLKKYSTESVYYLCGPPKMLENCFFLLKKYKAEAFFSLENKMGCALNVCRACVVKVKSSNEKGYSMATCCFDGPNFHIDDFPETGWW
jgi:dihydroorotate dehydrogenase electron transfer subunit